jgi:hypothetical protein
MQGRHMDHRGWRIVGLATVLAVLPMAAWAHTVGIEGDDALARGVNMSVLFLLSMPVAIVGVIFGTVYLAQKRAQRQVRQGLAGTQKARAHRQSSRQVLQVLAALFLD